MPAEFNNPITRRRIAQENQRKQFVVPDGNESNNNDSFSEEPQMFSDVEEQIRQARKEKAQGIQRLTPEAKKRIEILSGIGRLNKDVEIDGSVFSIRTLKSKEMQLATLAGLEFTYEVESAFEKRKQYVARSLHKIDGADISLYLDSDSIEARLELLDQLDETVVTKLFEEYNILNKEAKKKYGISSEKDVKEVSEDLKK